MIRTRTSAILVWRTWTCAWILSSPHLCRIMARVLVTGASGFIGGQLVDALLANGDDVTCLVRAKSDTSALRQRRVNLALGDVTEPSSLSAAIASADTVYHLAGLTKANTAAQFHRVNEAGVRNVVD